MPRKYHRPPSAKRRKSKKSTTPNVLEPLPEPQTDHSRTAVHEEPKGAATAETAIDVEEYAEEEDVATPAPATERKARTVRHLVADYTYVLSELKLSIGLAVFLIVALVITAILR